MLGAIIGDIAGSRFEFNNHRSNEFELLTDKCFATDDSFGNGAAMRVSPVGFSGRTLSEVRRLSEAVTTVTHNHPEELK